LHCIGHFTRKLKVFILRLPWCAHSGLNKKFLEKFIIPAFLYVEVRKLEINDYII
jgi:hypothetical protein